MPKSKSTTLGTIVTGVVTFLISVASVLLIFAFNGWVVSSLWNWLMPLFWAQAPRLTVLQAGGVLMLTGLLFQGVRK